MKTPRKIVMLLSVILTGLAFQQISTAQNAPAPGAAPGGPDRGATMPGGPGGGAPARGGGRGGGRGGTPEHVHTLAPYFTPATASPKAPDSDGFLQRWLLLDPIDNGVGGNTIFTDSYVRKAFIDTQYFPDQLTVVPKDGDKVTVSGQELAWHKLDSSLFNVKLFRFADGVNKKTYGVTFWAVTVVNSPREVKNVRLAAGSNSASIWWFNGEEAADLFGDRRMVMDDVVSKRLTLKQGKNIIRGAVINGPGLSDFCVRLVDENGKPIKDITIE